MTPSQQIKLLAYSSRIAWAFKAVLSLLISCLFALTIWDAKGFCVFFILFSLIGIVTDITLYLCKNAVFSFNVKDEDIPEKYGLKSDELLSFAKNFPKVRLLRIIPGILLSPFFLLSGKFSLPLAFLGSLLMIYFPACLLDSFWAKKLGVKLPSTYKLIFKPYFSNHAANSSPIIPFTETERDKYISGQISAFGYRNSVLEPLNNGATPIMPPPSTSIFNYP